MDNIQKQASFIRLLSVFVIAGVLWFLLWYASFSFILLDFNPAHWGKEARFQYVGAALPTGLCFSIAVCIAYKMSND